LFENVFVLEDWRARLENSWKHDLQLWSENVNERLGEISLYQQRKVDTYEGVLLALRAHPSLLLPLDLDEPLEKCDEMILPGPICRASSDSDQSASTCIRKEQNCPYTFGKAERRKISEYLHEEGTNCPYTFGRPKEGRNQRPGSTTRREQAPLIRKSSEYLTSEFIVNPASRIESFPANI